MSARFASAITTLALTASLCGCASSGISPGATTEGPQVLYGQPNRAIDRAGWIFGIPSKLALWDRRADNHDVSPQTVQEVASYLQSRDASDVLIRVNQYDPLGEWSRLRTNRTIPAGWRYTTGLLQTAQYTLIPGRLFGEDWYNPFTNSLHLYSDIPSLGVAKAGYAVDVRRRSYPGAYATTQILPVASLVSETVGTEESLAWAKQTGSQQTIEEAQRILYPSYGGSIGASLGAFLPFGNVYARLAGSVVGHLANGVRKQSGYQ